LKYGGVGKVSGSHSSEYEDEVFGMLRHVVCEKFTDVSEELTASIVRAMSNSLP
jgi:hypothetical protein